MESLKTGEESEPEQTDNLPVRMELDKEVYSVKEPVLIMTIEKSVGSKSDLWRSL